MGYQLILSPSYKMRFQSHLWKSEMHNHVMTDRKWKVLFKKNIQFEDTTVHKMQASLFHPVLLSRALQVLSFSQIGRLW